MKKNLTITIIITILVATTVFIYVKNNVNQTSEQLIEMYTEDNQIIEDNLEKINVEEQTIVNMITVEIKGEVISPGVYELEEKSRVNDLIKIAGGLTENAVTNNINLAKILQDEMVVVIYNQNDLIEDVKTEYVYLECTCPEVKNDACIDEKNTVEEDNKNTENTEENDKISINNATLEELMTLNGIGSKTATKIIEYRKDNPFKIIEDIKNISGIGESLYEKIKDSITI